MRITSNIVQLIIIDVAYLIKLLFKSAIIHPEFFSDS